MQMKRNTREVPYYFLWRGNKHLVTFIFLEINYGIYLCRLVFNRLRTSLMDNNCKVKQFYLDQIKEVLAQKNISIEESCQKQPRSSIENSNSEETSKKRKVEVVVFKDKNPGFKKVNISKKKLMSPNEVTEDQKMLKAKKLLKEIEWDVTSFGLKGFSLDEKRKLEQERAIRLGAKPRKQKYVNYKVSYLTQ